MRAIRVATLAATVALIAPFAVAPAEAAPTFFSGTGHYYEVISGSITWTSAKTAAEGLTFNGQPGHLVTILTSAENDFIKNNLISIPSADLLWIGATDQAVEGDWRWVTGELFWSGGPTGQGGSAQNGLFEAWDPGDPEPNNHLGSQHYAMMRGHTGLWSDSQDNQPSIDGYIVEYEPTLDHFKVYDVDDIPVNEAVLLEDQFANYSTNTLALDLFANPVDKNSEGILNVDEHQKWYSLPPLPVEREVGVLNQFGHEGWQTTNLRYLVAPSEKNASPGPGSCTAPPASIGLPCVQHSDCDVVPGDGVCGGLRHFACYDAAGTHDPIVVQLEDQFGLEPNVQVLSPRYWCNPVQKTVASDVYPIVDAEGFVDAEGHLACYDIEPKIDHAPLMVTTRDQLDESDVAIRTNELLCVPSIKVPPPPPLAVELSDFSGEATSSAVTLRWATESEIDNEGFNVLRSATPDGDFEAVNGALIPAEGGPAFGASYEFGDNEVKRAHVYYYLLEDIDTSGTATLHGEGTCTFEVDPDCEPLAILVPPGGKGWKKNKQKDKENDQEEL